MPLLGQASFKIKLHLSATDLGATRFYTILLRQRVSGSPAMPMKAIWLPTNMSNYQKAASMKP